MMIDELSIDSPNTTPTATATTVSVHTEAAAGDLTITSGIAESDARLSKKALRRQQLYELAKAKRPERRRAYRERVKERRKNNANAAEPENGNGEKKAKPLSVLRGKVLREHAEARMRDGQRVVMDLSNAHLMTDPECESLARQLRYAYSHNVRTEHPVRLILCSYDHDPRIASILAKQSGSDKWLIERNNENYFNLYASKTDSSMKDNNYNNHEAIDRETLIYLTAESTNVLHHLNPNCHYVVGGIVDHNRLKGFCETTCNERNVTTARLPIPECVESASRCRTVITVNQVIECLIEYGQHPLARQNALLDQNQPLNPIQQVVNVQNSEQSESLVNRNEKNSSGTIPISEEELEPEISSNPPWIKIWTDVFLKVLPTRADWKSVQVTSEPDSTLNAE